jgi:hypothetical protein
MFIDGPSQVMLFSKLSVWVNEFVVVGEERDIAGGCEWDFIDPSSVSVFIHDWCYREESIVRIILAEIKRLEVITIL